MTKYREIIRLASLNLSQTNSALSCGVSKKTVNKVLSNCCSQRGLCNSFNQTSGYVCHHHYKNDFEHRLSLS